MATNTRKLAALLGSSGANITDAGTINTAGITADAIDNTKIADNAVNADSIAANAVGTSEVADNVLTATDLAANSVGESELSVDYTAQSVPHIIPGVLYPSYVASGTSNKLLDGTTDHSGAFGTEQSDGRKYYYTNIAGSKPIKDPRIGGHFGSQRYKCTSVQLLEQETATHGQNVYSIDGREWARFVGDTVYTGYDSYGNYISTTATTSTDEFIEIVCYANGLNYLTDTWTQQRHFTWAINGGSPTTNTEFATSVASPLVGRYVGPFSVVNAFNGQTLGINTIRLNKVASHYLNIGAFELIVQDTSNRNNIQIPSQNVVSFGKKFPISATAYHYDPFTTMSYGGSGTTLSALQSLIDTDTSLGMDAWKAGTSNYHRPWNGGRVIKWVDSSGTIKTSVNMMPPNAQNITTTASNAVSDAHIIAGTNDDTINFNTSAVDHAQSEVAKTFHFREFGNGSANGGTGATYADASMLSGTDDINYVMDDGLTSFSGDDANSTGASNSGFYHNASGKKGYITFIGTGFRLNQNSSNVTDTAQCTVDGVQIQNAVSNASPEAQNLPFGTHVVSENWVTSGGSTPTFDEFTFYQPKRPPIPEDACVLADYMLMADFVADTSAGLHTISKGVRFCSSTRDLFYDAGGAWQSAIANISALGGQTIYNNNSVKDIKLPFFGHGITGRFHANTDRSSETTFKINDDVYDTNFNSAGTYTAGNRIGTSSPNPWDTSNNDGTFTFDQNTNGGESEESVGVKGLNLGLNTVFFDDNTSDYVVIAGMEIHSPIHTSSHYQTFETPFLHELVGGDRNMEQTNLVCSPDGKTWDEVTRDTSYIGKSNTSINRTNNTVANSSDLWIFDECRGQIEGKVLHNKDWAIAYNKMICLVGGDYQISWHQHMSNAHCDLLINDNGTNHQHVCRMHSFSQAGNLVNGGQSVVFNFNFERGDTIQLKGGYSHATQGEDLRYQNFQISRL